MLLASTPALTQDLHAAMHFMPKLGQRLTMCAVWGKACFAELDPATQDALEAMPAASERLRKMAHTHCLACAEQGVFQVAYELLRLSLKVGRAVCILGSGWPHLIDVSTQSLLCVYASSPDINTGQRHQQCQY